MKNKNPLEALSFSAIPRGFRMVEHRGFEPLTPTLPVLCAPNCANAPYVRLGKADLARPEGFEPTTNGIGIRYSIRAELRARK